MTANNGDNNIIQSDEKSRLTVFFKNILEKKKIPRRTAVMVITWKSDGVPFFKEYIIERDKSTSQKEREKKINMYSMVLSLNIFSRYNNIIRMGFIGSAPQHSCRYCWCIFFFLPRNNYMGYILLSCLTFRK